MSGRKRIMGLFGAVLTLALSGCSFAGFDSRALMSPPTATADQQAIYRLLQEGGGEITFAYPKNGEHRSAILMEDLTGDGVPDAVGFYIPEHGSGGAEVQFLSKEEDHWSTAAVFPNAATQVDRVAFCDLTGDGVLDVLIGWGSAAGSTGRTAAVSAYIYRDGRVEEYPLGAYGGMAVTDFDHDGVSEVFTVDMSVPAEEEGDLPTGACARVYAYENGGMTERFSCAVDDSVSGYAAVSFGRFSRERWGVLVDGTKADGSVTTQVLYLEDGLLQNAPAGVNTEEYVNPYTRPAAVPLTPRDVDGDGYLEIPRVSLLPALTPESPLDSTAYEVAWQSFVPESLHPIITRTLVNTAENYYFILPPSLSGRITAENNPENRSVTYRRATVSSIDGEKLYTRGETLFTVRVFTRSEWDKLGESTSYEPLLLQSDTVYALRPASEDLTVRQAVEMIKRDFGLLTE